MKYYNVLTNHLSGQNKEILTPELKKTNLDILFSYWYLKNVKKQKLEESFTLTNGNVFVDSRRFHSLRKKGKWRERGNKRRRLYQLVK